MLKYYVSWLSVRLGARIICVNVNEFQLFCFFPRFAACFCANIYILHDGLLT